MAAKTNKQSEIVSNHLIKAMVEINRAFRLAEKPSFEKRLDEIWRRLAKLNLDVKKTV